MFISTCHWIKDFVHDTFSLYALHLYKVSLKYFSNNYQVIERTQFCDGETDGWTQGEKHDPPFQGGDIIRG